MPTASLHIGTKTYVMRFIGLALASIAGVLLGFALMPPGVTAALVWPPSAIGVAALFLFGYDLWPALFLGIAGTFIFRGNALPISLVVALGNTLEAVLGAYILKKYIDFSPLINTLRNGLGVIAACIIPTLISGGVIALSSHYLGRMGFGDVQATWTALWIGHAVTCLSFTPFLIRWLYRPLFTKTIPEQIEGIFVFGSVSFICYLLFWTSYGSIGSISLIYVLILPLLWAAVRAGPRGTTLALALMSIIGASGIVYGHGPLTTAHNPQTDFLLQVLLGVLDLIFIVVAAVIEERKDATNSLAANVVQLEQAIEKIRLEDQAKTNFLAILAHELRNPLSPIVSSAELLRAGETTSEQSALVDTIESHARTITILLDDLLDIARITQNKFELRRERVSIQSVLMHSIESVKTFLEARGHQLKMEVPGGEIWLDADPVRLEQIFVNLLNNAIKYTDEGGVIALTCVRQGGEAVISIKDNGIGIEPKRLGGIFEPFGQASAVMRRPGGLGVGLSLTKRLVEQHQGTIEAKSRGLGLGSEFIVRLPLISAVQEAPPRQGFVAALRRKKMLEPSDKTGMRILVVDDNEPAAKGLGKLLEHRGYQVAFAYDGRGALMMSKNFKPAVVILDIGLPDMSGYEVGKKIREEATAPVRIIAVTGYGQEEDKIKGRDSGFDAHLVKPVGIVDVEQALHG